MSCNKILGFGFALSVLAGCDGLRMVGEEPAFTEPVAGQEHIAMVTNGMPVAFDGAVVPPDPTASLWSGERGSLLGDRRAMQRGDIMTVVIEIDDSASISNSTARSRSGSQQMAIPSLFGLPQRANENMPDGASLDSAVDLSGSSSADGSGSISRNEQLTLRVAATVVDVLPNGVLSIAGSQEVRVNFELRELLVTGYVRPADITRQNEITYDKIASARISYGGRGQITDMQQPRYGQQTVEVLLPF